MSKTLEEKEWEFLLHRINVGKCTPFLGAGACSALLPMGKDIAKKWAKEHDYPLQDFSDLARVSQFLAVEIDPMFPKEKIVEEFKEYSKNVKPFENSVPNEIHRLLSDLPLPVYMTTNYDDFMEQALQIQNRNPNRELCKWNSSVKKKFHSIFDSEVGFNPDVANPVVFHLHGHISMAESLVLTEDDYLDFLRNISEDQELLPPRIQEAFTDASLLFIGYQISDWDFRVLFRSLVRYLEISTRRAHISVQLVPGEENVSQDQKEKAQEYLDDYFGELKIRVYWGTASEFAEELKRRWEVYNNGN